MKNLELAQMFERTGHVLAILGENTLPGRGLSQDCAGARRVAAGRGRPGRGQGAGRVSGHRRIFGGQDPGYLKTGHISEMEELSGRCPPA